MSNLIKWENRIKEKRQKITFNDFIKEIASWYPLILNKNNGFISRYPKSDRVKGVLKYVDFEHTRDSLISKGVEYDFSLSFFENYKVLFKSIDLPSLIIYAGNENAGFSDIVLGSKNIYLSSAIIQGCENILYSFNVKENSVNILNSINVIDSCENVYLSVGVIKGFNIFYSRYIFNSNNVWFSRNLIGCSECIFCENLENKSYCINNVELEKEEYFKKKEGILSKKKEFLDWYKKGSINGINIGNQNVSGNFIFYSENIENGYFAYQIKNGRNILMWGGTKNNENVYDVFTGGSIGNQDLYAVTSAGANSSKLYCCAHISFSSNLYYSYFLESCSFCIGCIGLKNKSYCILNKQYSQDEWNILTDKIFAQMEIDGVLGNYFPADMNPFYFNDTMASIVGNFSKEEIIKDGYMWRDEEVKVDIPEGSEVIDIKDLDIVNYDESILKKVIKDDSGNYYRIVKMEYDFLKKYNLPLPEIHWLDRIKLGFNF